ncbi:putative isomerase YbhE [Trichodelitschia bisporula]|uniref:Putative isomerase YbhE n=1 Tax=Trichodelitschia bisporula TaxID=703511 RepID=A0A6G1IA90_9PEZI|nr:putative isomerase YbhE [Trichodelitschia bisporula]
MRGLTQSIAALLAARPALADMHHIFVSSFTTPQLYSLEFDDQKSTLELSGNIAAHDGHSWISFSYDKSAMYAGERDGFASYAVENSTYLGYRRSIELESGCQGATKGFKTAYVLPLMKAPFTVYGAPFGNCLNAMSVEPDGTLEDIVQNLTFKSSTGVQGMSMDPDNNILYSADDVANGIWAHHVDTESGKLEQVAFAPAPTEDARPRDLIVHPGGKFLFVVLEAKNEIAVYAINQGQEKSETPITFTGLTYSLIPQGEDPAEYLADEISISVNNDVLYASTRHRPNPTRRPRNKRRSGRNGYVTAILLVPMKESKTPQPNHPQGPGFPLRRLFQVQTSTSGGIANTVSPAPWGNEYFALSDSEVGMVQLTIGRCGKSMA